VGRHRAVPGLRAGTGRRAGAIPVGAHALSARAILAERLAALAPSLLEIDDDSAEHVGHAGAAGGGGHFSVTIVSEHFCGLTRLARHRAVLDRVGDLIPNPVHALAIRAYAPDEFPS
jgi:BolA protein